MKISKLFILSVLVAFACVGSIKGQTLHDQDVHNVTVGNTITLSLASAYQRTLNSYPPSSFSWTSGSTQNAIVQSSTKNYAVIKGVAPTNGTINIYYTCSYKVDGYYRTMNFYFMVKVNPILVSSITLSPSYTVTLTEGETMQFTATVLPTNAANKTLNWWSDDTSIATVSSNGVVTAGSKEGLAKITCNATDGSGVYRVGYVSVKKRETSVTLTDGSPYSNSENQTGVTVNYTRNFVNTSWQALYVPFAMDYEDWADKAEVADINNEVRQLDDNNDGVIDRTVIEFITKKSGAIEANKPYVIRPKQTGEVTFTSNNTTLYAAPETDGYVECVSPTANYILYGTYQEKSDMYENGYYGLSGGRFMLAESADVTLSPFRIYMKIENTDDGDSGQNIPAKVSLMVDGVIDDEATGIDPTMINSQLSNGQCYSLSGQKVSNGYKGIVIKNGKKVIVK